MTPHIIFLYAKDIKHLEKCNVGNDVLHRDGVKEHIKAMTIQIPDSSNIYHGKVRDLLMYLWLPSCPGPAETSSGDHWWRRLKDALEACLHWKLVASLISHFNQ